MTETAANRNRDAVDTSIPDGAASLQSILCTEELHRRLSRSPDYKKENRALVALAQALADSPRSVLQTLADTILEVCQAGSSGISLLTDDGGKRFYWPAIAGKWKPHIGGGTPRDFGPCGDVLDRNMPLLFRHVERRYTYFQPVTPPVEEALLIPFYVEGKAVGTIWAVAHDDRRKFDAEDERLMRSLGNFASSAYQILASLGTLRESEERHRFITESMPQKIFTATNSGDVNYFNRQWMEFTGLTFQQIRDWGWTQFVHPDDVDENIRSWKHSIDTGEEFQFEHRFRGKDGAYRWHLSRAHAMKDANGNVLMWIGSNTDIDDQKRTEVALRESEERLRTLAGSLEIQVLLRTRELEQRSEETLQQSEQLRELSTRLLQTQDDERRRIARELHDSVGQIITALAMNLADITEHARKYPPLAKSAQDSEEMVQQLSKEIRTMSYLLHPPLLDESGLSEAIYWYIQGLAERSGLSIELDISEDFGRLPGEIELAVFRIVQECLTNIHRHSGSQTATIRLSRTAENLSLEIQDEGKGISAEKLARIHAQRSGVGITGMRERVRHFGGVLNIHSNDNGTKVLVTIPVSVPSTTGPIPAQGKAAG